jgi:hypothetical protein
MISEIALHIQDCALLSVWGRIVGFPAVTAGCIENAPHGPATPLVAWPSGACRNFDDPSLARMIAPPAHLTHGLIAEVSGAPRTNGASPYDAPVPE